MTRLLLITLLVLLCSGPAYAEWVALGDSDSETTGYVDPDTIRRKGDLAKMWILLDYKTLQTVKDASYFSSRKLWQFDCAEERLRQLHSSWLSGKMGNGNVVWSNSDEGKWEPVAPRTVGHTLWELACDKK